MYFIDLLLSSNSPREASEQKLLFQVVNDVSGVETTMVLLHLDTTVF
jgi:hypothetical protein